MKAALIFTVTTLAALSAISHAQQDAQPQQPAQAGAQQRKPCIADAFRQFDFWVGNWQVFDPSGKRVGSNRIERAHGGCALIESWQGNGGLSGTSLNIHDRSDGQWHQTWVDSSGTRLSLSGGMEGQRMVMKSAASNTGHVNRISWEPLVGGKVRQLWETSADGGKTWVTAFDGLYVPQR
jgi:hypothetical protein